MRQDWSGNGNDQIITPRAVLNEEELSSPGEAQEGSGPLGPCTLHTCKPHGTGGPHSSANGQVNGDHVVEWISLIGSTAKASY